MVGTRKKAKGKIKGKSKTWRKMLVCF